MNDAKSIMNKPITINDNATLFEAIQKLQREKISRLIVLGELRNFIITEKDIGLYLLDAQTRDTLDKIPVSRIMRPLQRVNQMTSIKDCARAMMENSIGSLAVDADSSNVGIITKTDLVKYFAINEMEKRTVGEYTTWYYASMYSDATLDKVVQKMTDEKVSRIILQNYNEMPEGIIAFRDLFKVVFQANLTKVVDNTDSMISVISIREGFLSETGFGKTITAKEIMSDKIIAVKYNDDLAIACHVLLENKINAVGVLSSSEKIIGILSKTDITRALAYMD